MHLSTKKIGTVMVHILKDPLYKNSFYLMGATFFTSLLGFIFWVIAARYYTPGDVGLVISLVSASGLLATFSKLGLDFGLLRFLGQEKDRSGMINTSFTLAGVTALFLAAVFTAGLRYWSPALQFINKDFPLMLFFIISVPASSMCVLLQNAYVGMREARFTLIQNFFTGILKIPLPIILVTLGLLGLFLSTTGPMILVLIVFLVFILPRFVPNYSPKLEIRRKVVSKVLSYSVTNYLAETVDSTLGFLLPLIILNFLNKEASGYFYIAWTIFNVLTTIIMSISSSLLAELSFDEKGLKDNSIKAMKLGLFLLIPSILIVFFFGDKLLLLFGKDYSDNAFMLLRLLSIATIPVIITRTYVTIKRAELTLKPVIVIYSFIAVTTVILSYFLMKQMNIIGVGVAYLSVQSAVACFLLILYLRKGWITARNI